MRTDGVTSPSFFSIALKSRMKPCSLRRRQTSSFSFETGTSRRSCLARWAFLMRVKRSAMGSVMLIRLSPLSPAEPPLPARLDHAGKVALEGQVPEVDAAEPELAVEPARAAADSTPVTVPDLELQLLSLFGYLCGRRHWCLLARLALERHPELAQEDLLPLVVAG